MREQRRTYLLTTPLFVVSIGLLALNDFVLKASFHNWLTGKLSDFAGLVAFTIFACAIWPAGRWFAATAITAGFVFWKSPYSQLVIGFINGVLPVSVGRTADYSDCMALPGVWLVCLFVFRLRPRPVRNWLVGAMAMLSLFSFAATSYIPISRVTRTASIPTYSDQNPAAIEKQLQSIFDEIADRHDLRCSVCDPLSSGRLYVISEDQPRELAIAVNFDADRRVVFFDVSSLGFGPGSRNRAGEIDLIRAEIEDRLKTLFPQVKSEGGKLPRGYTLHLAIGKKNSNTSYLSEENREDYEKAVRVIESAVSRFGLKRFTYSEHWNVFYKGRLFGPGPSDHELVVQVFIADWPLVPIEVTSYAPQYSELQREIVDALERELESAFGEDRAWTRWGSRR